tara:strand:+ start:55 stop:291 length:237 start_codon:yes stop_codon:yes gene_type:complete
VEYFSATWCVPCKTFKPVLISEVDEDKLEIFDIEKNQDIATERGVRSIPTTIFYDEDGDEINRLVGNVTNLEIRRMYL